MTLDELWATFDDDVREIEEECEREQYCSDYEEQEEE